MDTVPALIKSSTLPNPHVSVRDFIEFPLPPLLAARKWIPHDLLSYSPPSNHVEHTDAARSLPRPPRAIVTELSELLKAHPDALSIRHPLRGGETYPKWVITWWADLERVSEHQATWERALSSLSQCAGGLKKAVDSRTVQQAVDVLAGVDWDGYTHGYRTQVPNVYLATYLTRDWFTTEHVDQSLDLLRRDLLVHGRSDVKPLSSQFSITLKSAFLSPLETYLSSPAYAWLRKLGHSLASGHFNELPIISNVGGNHWVASVLDFRTACLYHGDSLSHKDDPVLMGALEWFMTLHGGSECQSLRREPLPITKQLDGWSCGLLASNALHHHYFPVIGLTDTKHCTEERLHMLLRVQKLDQLLTEASFSREAASYDFTFHVPPTSPIPVTDADNKPCRSSYNASELSLPPPSSPPSLSSPPLSPISPSQKTGDLPSPRIITRAEEVPTSPPVISKRGPVVQSSVRSALESAGDHRSHGLLRFYGLASDEDKQRQQARDSEEWYARQDENLVENEKGRRQKLEMKRQAATQRKRKQRESMKAAEILSGVREQDGTKRRKVLPKLRDHNLPAGDLTIAELTRPARAINERRHAETKSKAGRKRTKQPRQATYHNWQTPVTMAQIYRAGIVVGWKLGASEIVKHLKRVNYDVFQHLNRNTIDNWIDRSGSRPKWRPHILAKMQAGTGNLIGHKNGGRQGIFAKHPELEEKIKKQIVAIRSTGAPVSVITARGLMIANILHDAPEIMQRRLRNGTTFKASDSFVRHWLHRHMNWSPRKGTQAAQKRPPDWETQVYHAFLRKVHTIKEEDIPPDLFVSADQTQMRYCPGDHTTWAETGSQQVSLVGADDKRAITVMVSVACGGLALPLQSIYSGRSERSTPHKSAPHWDDATAHGFLFEASGIDNNYWANQETMRTWVDDILAPYFDARKRAMGLPPSQKSLLMIDVWSVHRSEQFRGWMKATHPTIILDYVPGGCTGVFQPCDVGIQRPFKLAVKRAYHNDVVHEILDQLEEDEEGPILLEKHLPMLRDRTPRWVWNGFQAINNAALVRKSFQSCAVPGTKFNLSYESLTSYDARQSLRELKRSNPSLYKELTRDESPLVPSESQHVQEDAEDEDDGGDDESDMPVELVVEQMLNGEASAGMAKQGHGLVEVAVVEDDDEGAVAEDERPVASKDELQDSCWEGLGVRRSGRKRMPNSLYANCGTFESESEDERMETGNKKRKRAGKEILVDRKRRR